MHAIACIEWRTEKWDTPGVKMACVFIYMHQTSGLCWHVCMQLHALNGEDCKMGHTWGKNGIHPIFTKHSTNQPGKNGTP